MEKMSILIIDDDARNIFALSLILKSKGYIVYSATEAVKGISLLQEHKDIRMVLLDMMMPEMDGYQALGHMRNMDEIKDLPIIAVTAQAMQGDKEKCMEAGATDYISKPINVDKLDVILKQYFN